MVGLRKTDYIRDECHAIQLAYDIHYDGRIGVVSYRVMPVTKNCRHYRQTKRNVVWEGLFQIIEKDP